MSKDIYVAQDGERKEGGREEEGRRGGERQEQWTADGDLHEEGGGVGGVECGRGEVR